MPYAPESAPLSHGLLVPTTAFVGRQPELVAARHQLPRARCLTLTGPSGCGKSRLALEIATRERAHYPDGLWRIDLAAQTDPDSVVLALRDALELPEAPEQPPLVALIERLRPQRLLLLLDHCEHLVAGCRELVDALTATCPGVRVLATSRAPLGTVGESELPVPPLPVPPAGRPASLSDLMAYAAVRLFLNRTSAVYPRFTLTNQNAVAVADLCRRLEGIPLALELAAARSHLLTPDQLLTRLGDRLRLSRSGTDDPTSRTLRAVIEWSYETLTEPEQRFWLHATLFPASFTPAAAAAICAGEGSSPAAVGALVASLTARAILHVETHDGTEPRFRLPRALRAWAQEHLARIGEGPLIARYCQYYVDRAEQADANDTGTGLAAASAERQNLLGALRYAVQAGDQDRSLRLVRALMRTWRQQGRLREARHWCETVLAFVPGNDSLVAQVTNALAEIAEVSGDRETAWRLIKRAQGLYRALNDQQGLAVTYQSLGRLCEQRKGQHNQAESLLKQALHHAKLAADPRRIGRTLRDLGALEQRHGHYRMAMIYYTEALPLIRAEGDRRILVGLLGDLSRLADRVGEQERARTLLREAAALAQAEQE